MNKCQLACFIVTSREGGISAWVLQEVEMAAERKLPIFAFVESCLNFDQLGTLPSYTAYKTFDRGEDYAPKISIHDIPIYVEYVYNARRAALRKLGMDRETLLGTIESLRHNNESQRHQIDLLEHQLEPRIFDS